MDQILSEDNLYINIDSPMKADVSPYDASFPVALLSNGLKNLMADAQIAVKEIYRTVEKQAPIITQVKQAFKKGCRYVVDMSEQTLKDIEEGKLKLTNERRVLSLY